MTASEFEQGVSHGGRDQASPAAPFSALPVGLSDAEVAERSTPLDLEAIKAAASRRFFWRALRKNILSPLNLDLFTIGIIMFLLGSPWSMVGSLFILTINVSLNVLQEMRTKKRLDGMIESVRAMTTVIRGGQVRSIDPVDIVPGDVVVAAPGDLIPVEGKIVGQGEVVVEEPPSDDATAEPSGNQAVRGRGDRLVEGSYCLKGHTVYEAQSAGADRLTELLKGRAQILYRQKTPLQRLITRVFQTLGFILVIFAASLLVDALLTNFDVLANKYIADEFRTWLAILFAIAPTSMLFVFVVQYASGSLRMADAGALVTRAQSLEKLASVSALCFSRESLLSGLGLRIELVPLPAGHQQLSYRLVRRTMGNLVHSATSSTGFMTMLREDLPGERRRPMEEKPLLHDDDWYGSSFADVDMRGTFVVGRRGLLAPNLLPSERNEETRGEVEGSTAGEYPAGAGHSQRSWTDRLFAAKGEIGEAEKRFTPDGEKVVLAYSRETVPLFDGQRQPILPEKLVEVARLDLTESVRPELARVIREVLEAGVAVKVLAAKGSEGGPAPFRQADSSTNLPVSERLREGEAASELLVERGSPLPLLQPDSDQKSVLEELLGTRTEDLTPGAQTAAVQSLRDQGFYVAMVGGGVQDLGAMLEADVAVTLRGSSPALLERADAVLMEDSLRSLPRVMRAGQRVVNGLIDTLKLNLTPVTYQFFLILLLVFIGFENFPLHPNEGALISIFAVILPNILLTWWAHTGRLSSREMGLDLLRFIVPAAVATAVLAAGVYLWIFARTEDRAYAQVSVTWALLLAAWLRVFLVEPPSPRWVGASPLNNDKRIYGLVAGAVILFGAAFAVPLARQEFRISLLHSLADIGVIVVCLVAWYLALLLTWRLMWPLKSTRQDDVRG